MSSAAVFQTTHSPAIVSTEDLSIGSSGSVTITLGSDHALSANVSNNDTVLSTGGKKLNLVVPNLRMESQSIQNISSNEVKLRTGAYNSSPASELSADSTLLRVGTGDGSVGGYFSTTSETCSIESPGSSVTATDMGQLNMRGSSHDMVVQDESILKVEGGAIVIRKDVDIEGTLNNISGTATTLRVADPNIRLTTSSVTETEVQGASGVIINTVPADASDVPYMSGFKDSTGSPLFVANGEVDVDKSRASELFRKHFVHRVNSGARTAGIRSASSRASGPCWECSGGSLRMTRAFPSTNGTAIEYGMALRVSDIGTLEVIRTKSTMVFDAVTGTYTRSQPEVTVMQEG